MKRGLDIEADASPCPCRVVHRMSVDEGRPTVPKPTEKRASIPCRSKERLERRARPTAVLGHVALRRRPDEGDGVHRVSYPTHL